MLFSKHFIDTSKINQKTDQLVSLNTTAIGSKISPLRIPGLTKIKAFHRLSESRLAVNPSIGSCLHIFKRFLSGLEIESVIGSCSTSGFRYGPDPLFQDLSQVIKDNFRNDTLYVIDQSHVSIRHVNLTTNSTQTILQNNSAFNNRSTAHIYWHIHQMQSSAKIFILLRNAYLDTLVSHNALMDITFSRNPLHIKLEELTFKLGEQNFSDTWCPHSITIINNCDGTSYSEHKHGIDQCKRMEEILCLPSVPGVPREDSFSPTAPFKWLASIISISEDEKLLLATDTASNELKVIDFNSTEIVCIKCMFDRFNETECLSKPEHLTKIGDNIYVTTSTKTYEIKLSTIKERLPDLSKIKRYKFQEFYWKNGEFTLDG